MTAPDPVVVRPMPRLAGAFAWSTLAAEIEQERLAALADLPVPHPLRDAYVALAEARTAHARAAGEVVEFDAEALEFAEMAFAALESPPPRRGWLLRAIEGIFG